MGNPKFKTDNLSKRPLEERRMIARKSAEARTKKKYEKMALQRCMSALLENGVVGEESKKALKSVGFTTQDKQNNGSLLMTVLFKKAISGDVVAIREIISMMDKLDIYKDTGSLQSDVTINLISAGNQFKMSEEQEREIEQVQEEFENEDLYMDEWGQDVYVSE